MTLCDRRGRPKISSIKNADTDGNAKRGGFLHVKSVRIRRQAYKSMDNTNIVARAVRAALKVPELHGKWTLATAWCDPMTYATSELEKKRRDIGRGDWGMEVDITEEQAEQKKKVNNRWNECINLDARTFLRAGYKQIMEVFGKGENPWLFALPEFLDAPLLSHEDAMGIHLRVWPTNLPPCPSGVDEKLFNAVTKALTSMSFHDVDNTKAIEHTVRSEDEMMARSISEFNQMEAKLASLEQDHEEALRELAEAETLNSTKRANMDKSRSQLARLRNEGRPEKDLNEFETSIQEAMALYDEMNSHLEVSRRAIEEKGRLIENTRSEFESYSSVGLMRKHANTTFEERCAERRNELLNKIRRSIEELKVEVRNLVNEGASVRRAYALHSSARFLNTELLDFFLGLVPPNERTSAINDLDENGMTPLICSVMKAPERINEADKYYNTVQHLLRLGSDRSIIDPHGRTALGQYRMSVCEINDYYRTFSIQQEETQEWASIHRRMEGALMPIGGETEADKDAKDRGDEPVSSDDDEDDWDDIMDDEYDMNEEDWLAYGEGL